MLDDLSMEAYLPSVRPTRPGRFEAKRPTIGGIARELGTKVSFIAASETVMSVRDFTAA